ncbi:hypothetical protein SAMN05660691_03906 [Rheinheimera pacifica]|uniref:SMODS-associating 2TM beta-strand rich effector domain-containing protein n=1 Tax=Rheinheimera pacifica TaxID=173990 RepID=A0A1H6NJ51_9GAMM|nr:hypothetical protein [Rheinheimera pacifica]SEI12153.1 hypothetical protein SAMN05660691_03906 [Rheinheimera pacifica]
MNFETFWADLAVTLLGGVVLTFLFFLFRERIFPAFDITGKWYLQMTTEKSAYNPYKNMVLRYVLIIWREGDCIKGSAEKIYENSSTGEREFIGKSRTRAVISGSLEKNYLSKDRIFLHVVEDGHGRQSTNFYEVVATSKTGLAGTFKSMVADQDGRVLIQRAPF